MEAKIIHCPSCGSDLDIPENRSSFYCTYCGSKVLVSENQVSYQAQYTKEFLNERLNQNYRELVATGLQGEEISKSFHCSPAQELDHIKMLKEEKAKNDDLELYEIFDQLIAAVYARIVVSFRNENLKYFLSKSSARLCVIPPFVLLVFTSILFTYTLPEKVPEASNAALSWMIISGIALFLAIVYYFYIMNKSSSAWDDIKNYVEESLPFWAHFGISEDDLEKMLFR